MTTRAAIIESHDELAPSPAAPSAAALARSNWQNNLRALTLSQPRLAAALPPASPPVSFTFGRDGSLTALDAAGKWWRGCSIPLLASRAMLRSLDVQGRVACFLCPAHAAALTTALDSTRRDQAIIAVESDAEAIRMMLHCADLSSEIDAHRLWFAAGPDWRTGLQQLLEDQPGLATPSQFIRLPTAPAEQVEQLVKEAQLAFAAVNTARTSAIATARDTWRPPAAGVPRICVIAPSHFRLWHDGGLALAELFRADTSSPKAIEARLLDPDEPTGSSALAISRGAEQCHAVLAADTWRTDLPSVVSTRMPWLTWTTRPDRIPPFASAGAMDGLLLADPRMTDAARRQGWPDFRLLVCGWPTYNGQPLSVTPDPHLAVICDTAPIDPPQRLSEFSSHALLWNELRSRLDSDPCELRTSPGEFLEEHARRCGVAIETLDRKLFEETLIQPAYQQAVVKSLLRPGLLLRLYGHGWGDIPEFAAHAAGPVLSRQHLIEISAAAAALLHVWPGQDPHPVESLGRPVLTRRPGMTVAAFGAAARAALRDPQPPPEPRRMAVADVLALLWD